MDQLRQWRRDTRDGIVVRRNARRVIFDENHFGVVETGSVTKLMRKYRLDVGEAN